MSWIAFGSRLDIFDSRWDPGCLHLRASYEGLGLEGQDKPLSTRHEQAQRVAIIILTPPPHPTIYRLSCTGRGERREVRLHVTRGARVKRVAERVTLACGVSLLADSSEIWGGEKRRAR
jgi:hypothetical protein